MSLSEHEKNQFERLAADIQFDDSDMKEMAKKDKATAMGYSAWPSMSKILSVFGLIAMMVTVGGSVTGNGILIAVAGVASVFLLGGSMICSEKELAAAYHKTETRE